MCISAVLSVYAYKRAMRQHAPALTRTSALLSVIFRRVVGLHFGFLYVSRLPPFLRFEPHPGGQYSPNASLLQMGWSIRKRSRRISTKSILRRVTFPERANGRVTFLVCYCFDRVLRVCVCNDIPLPPLIRMFSYCIGVVGCEDPILSLQMILNMVACMYSL